MDEKMTIRKKQLEMGVKIEMEHTKSRKVAAKIAVDHLREYPTYYTELKKMEARLKKKQKKQRK